MAAVGTLAPAGTAVNQAPTYMDAPLTVTNTGGSLSTNGPLQTNGTTLFGPTAVNDFNEVITPSSQGLLAYNYPFIFATGTGSAVTTSGALYLAKLPLQGGTVVTNLWIKIATAASSLTSGHNFAGIYNSSGQLVATTADLTTTIGTNTGAIQCALTAPYTIPSGGGNYWVGMFFTASVTQPVLSAYTGFVTVTTSVASFGSATTFGNTAAKYPFSVSATGGTTAMPTSITMSSNTATGAYTLWVGVN